MRNVKETFLKIVSFSLIRPTKTSDSQIPSEYGPPQKYAQEKPCGQI